MKLTLSTTGLRLRLTYDELARLPHEPLTLACGGWEWVLAAVVGQSSALKGWPESPVLHLGFRDLHDLQAAPEIGIILNGFVPQTILDVDMRDRAGRG